MIASMLGNKVTTSIGAVVGILTVLIASPDLLPPAAIKYCSLAIGVLTSLGFVAAKDSTTGSQPR